MKKALSFIVVLAVLALGVFGYVRYYYVFGEGVKTGTLNYVVYKGIIFKTYEGKLIQSGLRAGAAGAIQSYEFEFSIEDPAIAEQLMLEGGEKFYIKWQKIITPMDIQMFTSSLIVI